MQSRFRSEKAKSQQLDLVHRETDSSNDNRPMREQANMVPQNPNVSTWDIVFASFSLTLRKYMYVLEIPLS